MIGKFVWQSQWFIKKSLRKIGIEIAHYYPEKSEYARCFPHAYYTYVPWCEKDFLENYAKVADRSTVTNDRSYILRQFARHCSHLKGDFAECGVYRGASAYLISQIIEKNARAFHLFDTFGGMPETVKGDPSGHIVGDFGDTSFKEVSAFLKDFPFIKFYQGLIPETFKDVKAGKFSFVHVDVDIYQSVKECCLFFYDRMVPGGVMVFDDYGFRQYEFSARKAVDEFFKEKLEKPISIHSGQSFIIKV